MVSLGPLNQRSYCSYRCAFCYVNEEQFVRYDALTPNDVVQWLAARAGDFDIVYVSGDTDSFARPRTRAGLELLDRLGTLGVDVLFTTRYVFADDERHRLAAIARTYAERSTRLIPCVSVAQLHHPDLEPRPVPDPKLRLEQLAWMASIGLPAVLAVRPLIPAVPAIEYVEIVDTGGDGCAAVLASDLYADDGGVIQLKVEQATCAPMVDVDETRELLPFSRTSVPWRIVRHPEAEIALQQYCQSKNLPFFMHSKAAVDYLRTR
jgi:hypothetical protein